MNNTRVKSLLFHQNSRKTNFAFLLQCSTKSDFIRLNWGNLSERARGNRKVTRQVNLLLPQKKASRVQLVICNSFDKPNREMAFGESYANVKCLQKEIEKEFFVSRFWKNSSQSIFSNSTLFLISNAKYLLSLIARAWHNTRKKRQQRKEEKKYESFHNYYFSLPIVVVGTGLRYVRFNFTSLYVHIWERKKQ